MMEIRNIIKLMLDFGQKFIKVAVKNYGIPKVSGLTYIAPPEYSSENNSNAGSKSNSNALIKQIVCLKVNVRVSLDKAQVLKK